MEPASYTTERSSSRLWRVAFNVAGAVLVPMAIQAAFMLPWARSSTYPPHVTSSWPTLVSCGAGLIFVARLYSDIRLFVFPVAILYLPAMFLFLIWFTWLLVVLSGGSVP